MKYLVIAAALALGACAGSNPGDKDYGSKPGDKDYGMIFGVEQPCFNTNLGYHMPTYRGAKHCKAVHAAYDRGDMEAVYNHQTGGYPGSGQPGTPGGQPGVVGSITSGR